MALPFSQRRADVFERLDHAEKQFQQLMNLIGLAEEGAHEPKYIRHDAMAIMATASEVFDYLGKDILELYILPNTSDPKLLGLYQNGKLNTYFPFFQGQLEKANKNGDRTRFWHELKTIYQPLYDELAAFVGVMERNEFLADTRFKGAYFRELRNMVNEKKHDKLLAVEVEEGQIIKFENEGMQMKFRRDDMGDFSKVAITPNGLKVVPRAHGEKRDPRTTRYVIVGDVEVKSGREYSFAMNKRPVADFCMYSVNGVKFLMKKFYDKYFS